MHKIIFFISIFSAKQSLLYLNCVCHVVSIYIRVSDNHLILPRIKQYIHADYESLGKGSFMWFYQNK